MRFSERQHFVDQVAQRMNPEKYTWSDEGKVEMRESAEHLLAFIDGYNEALVGTDLEDERIAELVRNPPEGLGLAIGSSSSASKLSN